ncbi:hypothetical protein [Streptomyces chryseus]|uniref:hypothetical protein n=1 Tax=Streptomyces chryseus TaxID=68186 RepID=UPI00110FB76E|nr:hypothetical protein [Streptomyces chryseus]GGW99675.1 hypothetical protein GCM10010353_14200 [Streptomyces chryseus]
MPKRDFTRAELAALGVPPDSPQDVQWSETLLADEPVATLKYTQKRRAVFLADDERTYAVEYEAPIDAGDHETGPAPDGHGWHGDTVKAVQVVRRPVVVEQWLTYVPAFHDGPDTSALQELTEVYEEGGLRTRDARQNAAELLAKHAAELAATADTAWSVTCDDEGHAIPHSPDCHLSTTPRP